MENTKSCNAIKNPAITVKTGAGLQGSMKRDHQDKISDIDSSVAYHQINIEPSIICVAQGKR